ncbi:BatD family protein [Antarcticirhabdus aurantiaca]|uniref:BatD family protein n=1 Tax=Antarcticirhabdus aurantiaca TaxID=2606717 RepID=A0ACD4NJK9_9HYPH|nr:BatD family protein [Antarcticirhabdus aurantiaca]WAJ26978.1 BatD family protein [Jeongeuplla avenae]
MVNRLRLLACLLLIALAGPAGAQGLAPATIAPPPQTLPRNADRDGNLAAPGTAPAGPTVAPDRPAPSGPAAPEAPLLDPESARLELIVEQPHADTHVEEMVLVRLRGVYTVAVAIEEMKQPPLVNFGWQQLGRDSWTSAFIDGKKRTVFERRLALYPSRPGRLEIGAFTHLLTVADGARREKRAVVSAPVAIEVSPIPPDAGGWWLPASRLSYSDEWDRDPSRLASGEVARRTVTIEAVGVPASRLPPRPKMLAEWLITFAEPEERTQAITPDGPVAKVVWRWRMRPVSSEPGLLEAFHIPWYDTQARAVRDIVLRSQRIALEGVLTEAPEPGIGDRLADNAPVLAAAAGFLLTGAVLLPSRRRLRETEWRRLLRRLPVAPERLRLAAAVRRGDAMTARGIVRRMLAEGATDGEGQARAALRRLDAALFGRGGPPLRDALADLGRATRRLR